MNAEEREFSRTLENQEQVDQLEQTVSERGREWLQAAEQWVRRNPYLAIGIAAAVGCAVVSLMRKED
ncbi:MAG TPA: hypothetical protein VK530_15115 [Candidatus Acidoferrum sp.]|nr:hypothetical protein [Candidatus Acidoferrum sp.]